MRGEAGGGSPQLHLRRKGRIAPIAGQVKVLVPLWTGIVQYCTIGNRDIFVSRGTGTVLYLKGQVTVQCLKSYGAVMYILLPKVLVMIYSTT